MKKKLLIELFIYAILVVIGVVLLFTQKEDKKPITIPSDFQIEEGVEKDAAIPGQ